MSSQPPPGFIHLILFSQGNPFYLKIPTATITPLCLHPRKYLRYLGWCVLGVIGALKDGQKNEIALDGELVDQGVYHYIVPGGNILAHAVDPEVIKLRTNVPSETTRTREGFRTQVLQRDGRCVWTGIDLGVGMHIIPHSRGDAWLQVIIENRPHDEVIESLTINDIQNGIFAVPTFHGHFDPRSVVVLKTPNPILETTDVPGRWQRDIATDVSYPTNSRYTLQWVIARAPNDQFTRHMLPNNNDATFLNQQLPKPADLVLHYNYGAAAVKQWGMNTDVLTGRADIPRPPRPVTPPMGPATSTHDRQPSIAKRIVYKAAQKGSSILHKIGNRSGEADSEEQEWDEDDVMLFFWGNSKAAQERHAQRDQECTEYLEGWRAGVTGNPDVV